MKQIEFESAAEREEQLEQEIATLHDRITNLESEERRLKLHAEYERGDVDELEGKTLKAVFYTLIGKKNEKLDQEYYEADEAKAQYEAAVVALESARKDLRRAEYALRQFRRTQKEEKEAFEAWLAQTRARLETLSPEVKREFLRLEQELMTQTEQQELILVAIAEGKKAIPLAEYVVEAWEDVHECNRHDNIFAEYELRDEAKERQKMFDLQLKRFSEALMKINFGNSDFSSLKNIGGLISPLLGELNELLKLHREKQELIMDRIRSLIEQK